MYNSDMQVDSRQKSYPKSNPTGLSPLKKLTVWFFLLVLLATAIFFGSQQLDKLGDQRSEDQALPGKTIRRDSPISEQRLNRLKHIDDTKSAKSDAPATPKSDTPKPRILPSLEESDKPVKEAIDTLIREPMISSWLIDQYLIQKFVALIDNMARGQLPRKLHPFKGPDKPFTAVARGGALWLDSSAYNRFDPFTQMIDKVDIDEALLQYQHYYPLLQQAYVDLGYPNQSFHHRFIQAVDLLLQTPEIGAEVKLHQPGVRYKYLDEEIERLSAAEKQLIRMGPANMKIIKSRLEHLSLGLASLAH